MTLEETIRQRVKIVQIKGRELKEREQQNLTQVKIEQPGNWCGFSFTPHNFFLQFYISPSAELCGKDGMLHR